MVYEFWVALKEVQNDETEGWIGVTQETNDWCVYWHKRGVEEGEVRYRGPSLEAARQSCLEQVKKMENQGYRLSFPIHIGGGPGKGRSLTIYDYFSAHHYDEKCYEELRQWRYGTAQRRRLSAFIIATNRMLKQLAAFLPHTEEEALQIQGFTAKKWEQYGREIVAITQKHTRVHEFPLHWVKKEVQEKEFEEWKVRQLVEQQTQKLEREEQGKLERKQLLEGIAGGTSLQELAKQVGRSPSTVLYRLTKLQEEGYEVMDWLQEEAKHVSDAGRINETIQELDTGLAKPIFEKLYDGLSAEETNQKYTDIRVLLTLRKCMDWEKGVLLAKDKQVS